MIKNNSKIYSLQNFDKSFAIFCGLCSLILILYLLLYKSRIEYLLIGFLIVISSTFWIIIRKRLNSFDYSQSKATFKFIHFQYIFVLFYLLSILIILCRTNLYERPLSYFIIITLIFLLLCYEIYHSDKKHAFNILCQIIALGINICWSQLFLFPGLLGIDPWFHYEFTSQIINFSHIPEGYSYAKFPLFHLIVSVTSLVTNLNYKLSVMMSISIAQIICNTFFIYLIALSIFKNHKIGCFSSLFVIISNYHIFMSYWSIPNSLAGIFIPIIIYLIFIIQKRNRFIGYSLILLFFLILILTHTLTSVCMAIILFVIWITSYLYFQISGNKTKYISLIFVLLFTLGMFTWWSFASNSIWIFSQLIKWGFSIDFFMDPTMIIEYITQVPPFERIFRYIGMYLFFSFSLIGIFYMISEKGTKLSYYIAITALTPLLIVFLSNLLGFELISERWWFFSEILLSIPLAVTVLILLKLSDNKWYLKITSLSFVSLLAFLLIISPSANIDNHMFVENSGITHTLKYSELHSNEFLLSHNKNSQILSDQLYFLTQRWTVSNLKDISNELFSADFNNCRNSIILIREAIINKPMKLSSTIITLNYNPNYLLSRLQFQKIYDSKSVILYFNNVY